MKLKHFAFVLAAILLVLVTVMAASALDCELNDRDAAGMCTPTNELPWEVRPTPPPKPPIEEPVIEPTLKSRGRSVGNVGEIGNVTYHYNVTVEIRSCWRSINENNNIRIIAIGGDTNVDAYRC
jgi:hypothetical protein